jgi:hypothetical protein
VGFDVGVTKEYDLVGGSERQVDKETVGCDVGVTKEDDLVGGSERQVDTSDCRPPHLSVIRSSCFSIPQTNPSP